MSEEDFKNAAQSAWNCTFGGRPILLGLEILPTDTSGYVSAIVIGGEARKGTEARTAFGLRSANFEVKYENGTFTFYVKWIWTRCGYESSRSRIHGKSKALPMMKFWHGITQIQHW